MPTLDIVIVTWNCGETLARCLASLEASVSSAFTFDRIVIVDNASTRVWQPPRYEKLPPVTLLRNDVNRGFAVACNQGAIGSQADFLLFINPDTEIASDALARALAAFEEPAHHDVAVVGLQLVDARGIPQATCGRFLTPRRTFNQVTGLSLLSPRRFPGFRMTEWDHRGSRAVDYVSAACMLVRRPVFEAMSGFDERFTVYLEDVDFAWRAHQAGWRSHFLAESSAYHASGWVTGRDRSLRLAHAWRSLLVYGIRHWGPAGRLAAGAIVFPLAPLARLGEGLAHGSLGECRDALTACVRLGALLRADLGRRLARSPAIDPAVRTSS